MFVKTNVFVLTGKSGQKVVKHIQNAQPKDKPLYTKNDAKQFRDSLIPHLDSLTRVR